MLRRVLLKISGQALGDTGIDGEALETLTREIKDAAATGAGIGVVLGGGNLLRARDLELPRVRRAVRDRMGMLATIANALALADSLSDAGQPAEVFTATPMPAIAEPFRMERARTLLDRGRVILLAGGTGHPYFTTDTAAALRALEIGAEALLKATKVDGVYSADPHEDPDAVRYDKLSYDQVLKMELGVMDLTSITLCRENGLPVHVFDMSVPGNMRRVILGEEVGTRVGG
ncbi:MAG: UMP kinase [Planctomycetota bacterium]